MSWSGLNNKCEWLIILISEYTVVGCNWLMLNPHGMPLNEKPADFVQALLKSTVIGPNSVHPFNNVDNQASRHCHCPYAGSATSSYYAYHGLCVAAIPEESKCY